MRASPLLVAGVAAVLLLVVLGVDATVNRTYRLEVEDGTGWRTLGTSGEGHRFPEPPAMPTVDANGSVRFRLRADNGWPFAHEQEWVASANGFELARGRLVVPAGGSASAEFEMDPRVVEPPMPPDQPRRVDDERVFVTIEVRLGSEHLYGSLQYWRTTE